MSALSEASRGELFVQSYLEKSKFGRLCLLSSGRSL